MNYRNVKYQKSSIRAYNTSEQTFATSGKIIFTDIGYKSGVSIDANAGSSIINLKTAGLYYVTLDVVMSNTTADTDVSVQIYKDGVAIEGALTEATITAANDLEPGTVSAVVPVGCGCSCSNDVQITFVVTGTTSVITNANVNVIKLA